METKELIAKIEALAKDQAAIAQAHGVEYMTCIPPFLDTLEPETFVDLCDHYDADPLPSAYPSVWISIGGLTMKMSSAKVAGLDTRPRANAREILRNAIEASKQSSAAA